MSYATKLAAMIFLVSSLGLGGAEFALAKTEPGACVELGALVWNDWTSVEAGGSGLPAGAFSTGTFCSWLEQVDKTGIQEPVKGAGNQYQAAGRFNSACNPPNVLLPRLSAPP